MTALPKLSQARVPLTCPVMVHDEHGRPRTLQIPAERGLTVYVDKRELVTLMTLGAHPEWLTLGFLRNQRLLSDVHGIDSVTVDWEIGEGEMGEPGVAAVRLRPGARLRSQAAQHRVVTTGCGQGSVFGQLLADVGDLQLPQAQISQSQLYRILETMRQQETVYKQAGSVHGCALFRGDELLFMVEDVGRHNAVDTIAGWMWMHGVDGADKVFYTTGRLTSEMVIKSAQMGVPVLVSRSGMSQMGLQVARHLGLCAIGRALHRRFVCFSAPERLLRDVELPAAPDPA